MAGCIFCGTSPTTLAHIFRRAWLAEVVMPSPAPFRHHHVREGEGAFEKFWLARESGLAVNCACGRCNNAWMDQVDRAGEAIAEPMVRGEVVTIRTMREQYVLATWATLVLVLFDQTQAAPIIESVQHQALREQRRPLRDSAIWLARTRSSEPTVNGWPRTWRLEAPRSGIDTHSYFCTFRVNDLVVQAYIPVGEAPTQAEMGFDRGPNAHLIAQLWPPNYEVVKWPDGFIAEPFLGEFANAFRGDI
jgi:hypothetical protein